MQGLEDKARPHYMQGSGKCTWPLDHTEVPLMFFMDGWTNHKVFPLSHKETVLRKVLLSTQLPDEPVLQPDVLPIFPARVVGVYLGDWLRAAVLKVDEVLSVLENIIPHLSGTCPCLNRQPLEINSGHYWMSLITKTAVRGLFLWNKFWSQSYRLFNISSEGGSK